MERLLFTYTPSAQSFGWFVGALWLIGCCVAWYIDRRHPLLGVIGLTVALLLFMLMFFGLASQGIKWVITKAL